MLLTAAAVSTGALTKVRAAVVCHLNREPEQDHTSGAGEGTEVCAVMKEPHAFAVARQKTCFQG